MTPKLLFFDVDNTLVDPRTHDVPESAVRALTRARANGHHLFINTGRVKSIMQAALQKLPMDGICYGCGSHIEYRGEILLEKFVPAEDVRIIRDAMLTDNIQGIFQGPEFCYFDDRTPRFPNYLAFIKSDYDQDYHAEMRSMYEDDMKINKLMTFRTEESDYADYRARLAEKYQLVEQKNGYVEIMPLPYSKATAIDFLMEHLRIPAEDVYTFGDSTNDLPMLTHAGTSVCMGNGYEEVKKVVDYVTTAIDDDGILHALEHFALI